MEQEREIEFVLAQSQEDYNPVVEWVDYPITLENKIFEYVKGKFYKFVSYTAYDNNLKQFVKHTYGIRTGVKQGIPYMEIKEVRRDFETYPTIIRDMYYCEYGMARGCHVIWQKKRSYYQTFEPNNEWYVMDTYFDKKMGYTTLELNSIEDIIAHDLSLRYMGFKDNGYIALIDYIKLYRKEPIVETLMKLGLYRFIENEKARQTVTTNKAFRKWLYRNYEDCEGLAFQTVFNSFKKNPNNSVSNYYNSLMYRIECGKELSTSNKSIYAYTLKYTTQEKMVAYLEDNGIGRYSYFDYLTACRWLQLDFNDTKVLFPKEFMKYHDDYVTQYAEWKREEERKKQEKESKEITSKMLKIALKFSFCELSGKSYEVINAKSKMDLIEEGSKLNHCVGKMNYDKKQAEGESLICFLRKADSVNVPYVTIQLDLKQFKVLQAYGNHDSKPSQEVLDFINNEWLPKVKRCVRERATV